MPLVRTLLVILGLAFGAVLAVGTVFVVGVRRRDEKVLRFARKVQRDLLNPGTLRDAGTAGSPWAIIRVPGRTSGRVYDTPVGVQRVGDDLYISLVYGDGTQWVRNVRAAGGATVLHDGHEIEAVLPELVAIVQMPMTAADRVAITVFGVTHALRLRAVNSVPLDANV
jgi:deazaflavin-dependent oxidoreductase (nitroreductase family)